MDQVLCHFPPILMNSTGENPQFKINSFTWIHKNMKEFINFPECAKMFIKPTLSALIGRVREVKKQAEEILVQIIYAMGGM